jgi:DNA-binding beta-propeller fold protein YncE
MPHGLKIDSEGNVWVTDVGRHQVMKFSPNNLKEPVFIVGEERVPGNDKKHFCQPADVAILKNGDFFVADGYCNSRIVKFNKNGEFLAEWSSEDEGMPSHFFVPHSLALHEKQNLICIADRENYRVQCFDLNGNFLHETLLADNGPIYSVSFSANNGSVVYAVNGYNSRLNTQYDKKVFVVSTKTGLVTGSISLDPEIRTPHSLAVSDDQSEIYIGNLNPAGIYKYALVNYGRMFFILKEILNLALNLFFNFFLT